MNNTRFLCCVVFIFNALFIQSLYADKISDNKCKEYEKKHPYPYQGFTIEEYKFKKRLKYEYALLEKFPNSYMPYFSLGYTYDFMCFSYDWKIEKNRQFLGKKALHFYKKSLSLCQDEVEKPNIRKKIDQLKKFLSLPHEQLIIDRAAFKSSDDIGWEIEMHI